MTKIFMMDFSDKRHNLTTIATMAAFCLLYSSLYVLLSEIFPEIPTLIINRIVSMLHGVITSLACLYYVCGPAFKLYKGIEIN